jgi:guanylate kinase
MSGKEITMQQTKIIDELIKLPESEILFIMEKTLHIVRGRIKKRESDRKQKLMEAANALYEDYSNDEELKVFTALDGEAFHE